MSVCRLSNAVTCFYISCEAIARAVVFLVLFIDSHILCNGAEDGVIHKQMTNDQLLALFVITNLYTGLHHHHQYCGGSGVNSFSGNVSLNQILSEAHEKVICSGWRLLSV